MDRIKFFLKIFIITFIVAGAVFFFKSSNPVLSLFHIPFSDVKGASTERAQKITGEIASDIGDGVNTTKNQFLNMKVSDILNIVSRAQKIPKDIQAMQQYVKEQVDNVLKSKK